MKTEQLTIGERAEKSWLLHLKGNCHDYTFAYIQAAIVESDIARQEERERCINIACKVTCACCMSSNVICNEQENCKKLEMLRNAMKKGSEK